MSPRSRSCRAITNNRGRVSCRSSISNARNASRATRNHIRSQSYTIRKRKGSASRCRIGIIVSYFPRASQIRANINRNGEVICIKHIPSHEGLCASGSRRGGRPDIGGINVASFSCEIISHIKREPRCRLGWRCGLVFVRLIPSPQRRKKEGNPKGLRR